LESIQEIKGSGIQALFKNQKFRLGSAEFTGFTKRIENQQGNIVCLTVEGQELGYFLIESGLREKAAEVVGLLKTDYDLHVLSGDFSHEQSYLEDKLGENIRYNFKQSPTDKLTYLK